MTCEDFWCKARKQVPRIAELCVGSADAALRQKDRKATSFYPGREYHHARLRTLGTEPYEISGLLIFHADKLRVRVALNKPLDLVHDLFRVFSAARYDGNAEGQRLA